MSQEKIGRGVGGIGTELELVKDKPITLSLIL